MAPAQLMMGRRLLDNLPVLPNQLDTKLNFPIFDGRKTITENYCKRNREKKISPLNKGLVCYKQQQKKNSNHILLGLAVER